MKHKDTHIISDQEYCFNENSTEKKVSTQHELFNRYANKAQLQRCSRQPQLDYFVLMYR